MNKLTINIFYSFSRTPMIKFIGPRSLLPPPAKKVEQAPPSSSALGLPPLSNGPSLSPPSVRYAALEPWQIDAINEGGIISAKPIKVKPIKLRR